MGFMTEICFLNDGWRDLKESILNDPKTFVREIEVLMNGRAIYDRGGDKVRYLGRELPGDFDGLMRLGNGSTVYPSHHADDPRLYLSWRNSFLSLSRYDLEEEFDGRFGDPNDGLIDVLERDLKVAQGMITETRKWLKEKRAAQKSAA